MSDVKTVKEVLEGLCPVKNISEKMTLSEDLGLDSLKMVTLLLCLEEKMGVELDQSDMNPFELITVGDVISLAKKYRR